LEALGQYFENKNKTMKDAARLDDSAEGSVNRMRARLKELTAEYNKLAPAARDKVAPAINKLSAELKKAEGVIGNNTRNVGNYKTAILEAGKQVLSFTGLAGGATAILGKLKDAFLDTQVGANIFSRAQEATKTFLQNIVKGNALGAGTQALAAFKIAKETNTQILFENLNLTSTPTMASKEIQDKMVQAAESLGISYINMQSGAGHDVQEMAALGPIGLVFIPSKDGISHAPKEYSSPQDIANGANVLFHTILSLDKSLQ
jgi:acetylornithine deacetylase/succinyl-diaminopimelate desuccinylase-like protein